MVKVNDWKSPLLVEAVLVWTGWGREIRPTRNVSALTNHFGAEVASELLPVIKFIADEFYATDAKYVAADLEEMERMAVTDFKMKYPSVAEEIVKALAWCYTFDFK